MWGFLLSKTIDKLDNLTYNKFINQRERQITCKPTAFNCNIEYMKRMNKVFEQLETKLGKFRH